jgi:type IV pilus assembly protein PilA
VVAIVGLLAAIAVPSFLRMQLKAKRSEVFVNVKSIAMAEIAYEKVYDSYIACLSSPNTTLDTQLHPFDPTVDGWDKLEWIPDGWVRCHYYVQEFTNPKGTWVRPSGVCDMDGDKKYATWYMDVDPRATSSSSQNMVMRGDAPTMTYTRY